MKRALDEMDVGILRHLEQDGRRSYSEIAEDLGVAVSTVSARVARLTEQNVVSVVALINPHAVGFEAAATLLLSIEPGCFDEVVASIIDFPEVNYAAMTTGPHNLVVDVFCRDAQHLAELITGRVHDLDGVQDVDVAYQLRRYEVKQKGVALIEFDDEPWDQGRSDTASR